MKKIGLGIKIGLLLLITVVLQLPISLIKDIVAERQDNQTQVTQQLSKNVGGEQLIYLFSPTTHNAVFYQTHPMYQMHQMHDFKTKAASAAFVLKSCNKIDCTGL